MRAALIAAGLGERLRQGGVMVPKPLVPVAGKALVDYVLGAAGSAGITHIAGIVNEEFQGVEEHCRAQWPQLQFDFIRRTTPSSMESLFALRPLLARERFLLLTVDAVFAPRVLQDFLRAAAARPDSQGVLALSTFIDDEKPLWTRVAADGRVTALGSAAAGSALITAGFYVFEPVIFDEVSAARQAGFTALRQFLGHLLQRGYRLYGAPIGKTVDVDRPEDIAAAEAFIHSGYAQ